MQQLKNIGLVLGVTFSVFFVSFIVLAWSDPIEGPTGGSVYIPINESASSQVKIGSFGVGGVFQTNSATYLAQGNVTSSVEIGSSSTSSNLTVYGNIDMNNGKITNLSPGVNATDAVTYGQIQSVSGDKVKSFVYTQNSSNNCNCPSGWDSISGSSYIFNGSSSSVKSCICSLGQDPLKSGCRIVSYNQDSSTNCNCPSDWNSFAGASYRFSSDSSLVKNCVCYSCESGSLLALGSIFVPVGAEGYDSEGNLVIARNSSGTLEDKSGQVVFLDTKTYSNIAHTLSAVDVLVVAGGGSAGGSGGGGAGGLISKHHLLLSNNISVTVGAGGNNSKGGNSILESLTAIGGGRGADNCSGCGGGTGGSGGGGGANASGGAPQQPSSLSGGYGNWGGYGYDGTGYTARSGGGGGAGGGGGSAGGGAGMSIWGKVYAAGGTGYYYGGGWACRSAGAPNTGDGGGACSDGGSGIVIIRWGEYNHNYIF